MHYTRSAIVANSQLKAGMWTSTIALGENDTAYCGTSTKHDFRGPGTVVFRMFDDGGWEESAEPSVTKISAEHLTPEKRAREVIEAGAIGIPDDDETMFDNSLLLGRANIREHWAKLSNMGTAGPRLLVAAMMEYHEITDRAKATAQVHEILASVHAFDGTDGVS